MAEQNTDSGSVQKLADMIVNARRMVVFTGAGVSTESGIPDFRGPGGLWSKYDPDDFTIHRFLQSADVRKRIWEVCFSFSQNSAPNAAHHAIAELGKMGKVDCVITQNVDNLHQRAGSSPERVFELHGNLGRASCLSCRREYSWKEIEGMLSAGVSVPDCPNCGGILKPSAVFFGEALPQRELEEATQHSQSCDLFLVIGSTLVVYPAAYMPVYALNSGAKLAIINLMPTPLDDQAAIIIRAKAGETMSQVVDLVRKKIEPKSGS